MAEASGLIVFIMCNLFVILVLLLPGLVLQAGEIEDRAAKEYVKINEQLRLLSQQRTEAKKIIHLQFEQFYRLRDSLPDTSRADSEVLQKSKTAELGKLADLYKSNLITRVEMEKREKQINISFEIFESNRIDRASSKSLALLHNTVKSNDLAEIKRIERALDDLSLTNFSYYLILSSSMTNEAGKVLSCNLLTGYELKPTSTTIKFK